MSKRDVLLEIGLEEMPARFVQSAVESLGSRLKAWFTDNKIEHGDIRLFSTPRRLAAVIENVAERQTDTEEEAKGPAKKIAQDAEGNWSKAAIGFSRGQGMSPEDIYFREIKGVEYAHVKKFTKGRETLELLPELEGVITALNFPKSMRWGAHDMRYIRPIKWIVALFGNEVIPFSILNVPAGRVTRGHRFLGKDTEIEEPGSYEKMLMEQYVIADAEVRKNAIIEQINKLEQEHSWVIPMDEDLLNEVTNLVEYPTALFGTFSEAFLQLPEEVLITSMKEHQRYFPVKSEAGRLLPYFVTVRNGDHRHLDTVAKGNEKVLRARLSDADFFYKEDQKLQISDALVKLDSIVYHEKIGTLSAKITRVRKNVQYLAEQLQFSEQQKNLADRAAEISKFDLVSNMVNEFPELQGIMGEKYALQKGESPEVAQAVNEHYMPRSADGEMPKSAIGAAVAIAEKLDTVASIFAIGLIPTGSQDPYALRRQAAGIVQILRDQKWNVSLRDLLGNAAASVASEGIGDSEQILSEAMHFFALRIKHIMQEEGIRYDIIEAVLKGELIGVPDLFSRAEILNGEKDRPGFKETMEALSRVLNISSKAEGDKAIDESLFENEYEQHLYAELRNLDKKLDSGITAREEYEDLAALKPAIEQYFDHTMVMADNLAIRDNRLAMMKHLAEYISRFADMNEVIVK